MNKNIEFRIFTLVIPFLFLILFGIAFQLDLVVMKISVVTLSLYALLAIYYFGDKPNAPDNSKKFLFSMNLLFMYVFASAFMGFVVGNSIDDIKQDVIGFVHLWIVYYCAKRLEIKDLEFVWKIIIIISVVAVLKIFYINFSDVSVEWTNAWQARKDPLPGLNWNRIVLNGGDIYLTFSLISVFTLLIFKSKIINPIYAILAFIILTFSVFISLSRSSYLAVGLGFVSSLLVVLFQGKVKVRNIMVAVLGIVLVTMIFVYYESDIIDLGNIYLTRIEAYDSEGGSLMWREIENENVFNEVQKSWLFGNGMGATYKFYVENSDRANGTNIFTHDFLTWVLLKMGVLGLILVLLFLGETMYRSLKFLMIPLIANETKVLLSAFISSFIGLIVISILANKMFYTEGSMFMGLYLGFLHKLFIVTDKDKMITVSR